MIKKSMAALLALFLAGGSIALYAGKSPLPGEPAKKLIQFGWDNPTPELFFKQLSIMEKNMPYDGIGIKLALHRKFAMEKGKKVNLEYRLFSPLKFERKWFEKDIAYLKKVKPKKLKHNFLSVGTAYFGKEYSIFSDRFWEGVNHNVSLMASIAREGGLTGLRIDLEDYGNMRKWNYRPHEGKSWDEAWNMARKRGRDYMNAITKEFPDAKLYFLFFLDLAMGVADGEGNIYERLKSDKSGLLVAFINGMYDVLPPTVKIIDGMEHHGYTAKVLTDYHALRAIRETKFRRMIAPENQLKFIRQTSLSVATYLDAYIKTNSGHINLAKELAMTPTELLRRNLSWAVAYSDEYVWTWSECRKWFPMRFAHAYQEKTLKRHPHARGPYWMEALPGIQDAIECAKNPTKYIANAVQTSRISKNLLKNGNFDGKMSALGKIPLAPDSIVYKNIPRWENWQTKRSKGKFGLAIGKGINGSNALMQTGTIFGVTHQAVKVKPYGLYIVRACAKMPKKPTGLTMSVKFRNKQFRWYAHEWSVNTTFNEDLGNSWKRATIFIKELPPGVGAMSIALNSDGSGKLDEVVYFDNAEIFEVLMTNPAAGAGAKKGK